MNNNKLHKSSAIFLATVLVAGIIALSSPSFMVGAQAVPQYGMEREYGSYEQPEYGMDSYEKPSYRNDNYEQPEYGMDSYEKPSYRNDNYEQPEYQSYKPDYKPAYPSYEKDNRDKSKKDSVSINKVKCINTNLNINGNNAGNVSIGNKGQGYLGTYSSADGRNGGNDGYGKQDKGLCIINNNNNNTNIVAGAGAGGNATDGNVTEPDCTAGVACIKGNLDATQLAIFYTAIGITADATDAELCIALGDTNEADLRADLEAQVTPQLATFIINCLIDAGFTNLE